MQTCTSRFVIHGDYLLIHRLFTKLSSQSQESIGFMASREKENEQKMKELEMGNWQVLNLNKKDLKEKIRFDSVLQEQTWQRRALSSKERLCRHFIVLLTCVQLDADLISIVASNHHIRLDTRFCN